MILVLGHWTVHEIQGMSEIPEIFAILETLVILETCAIPETFAILETFGIQEILGMLEGCVTPEILEIILITETHEAEEVHHFRETHGTSASVNGTLGEVVEVEEVQILVVHPHHLTLVNEIASISHFLHLYEPWMSFHQEKYHPPQDQPSILRELA